jgi:hypothetical protein
MQFKLWLENQLLTESIRVIRPQCDVQNIIDASYYYGMAKGNETVPTSQLRGGVRLGDPRELKRVQDLAAAIKSPKGYIERLIVDDQNNVVEGQHRLEALRMLRIRQAPIYRIVDLENLYNVPKMTQAIKAVIPNINTERLHQLVKIILDTIVESGSPQAALEYELPPQWQAAYEAALKSIMTNQ